MKKLICQSFILLFFISCKTTEKSAVMQTVETVVDCNSIVVDYEKDIVPIFQDNCVKCHGKSGGAGGYDFTYRATIDRAAKSEKLLGALKHKRGFQPMPARSPKLDASQIAKIECWINNETNK